jgi:hypothetical protein
LLNGLWLAGKLPDLELVLPDFRRKLNAADRNRRCTKTFEAQHWSDPLLHAAVVLFPPHY